MDKEISALREKNTWVIVKRPKSEPVITCRWVYKLKKSPENSDVKYKSRLVARGFSQEYGVNYWDTYAPVVKNSTIRLLFAIAAQNKWRVEQVDCRNAYVNSELSETIYMEQPQGYEVHNRKEYVCKLIRSLYGLKQSGNEWNKLLNKILVHNMKFRRIITDSCVYVKNNTNGIIVVAVYVDDLIIMSNTQILINQFKEQLNDRVEIDDIGEIKKVVGINVEVNEFGIKIHQTHLIEQIAKQFGLINSKPVYTPMEVNNPLQMCTEEKCVECLKVNPSEYRSITGSLNYIAGSTRPDISYAVSTLSRYNNKPHISHLIAAKRVIRYLNTTKNYTIVYKREGELRGYCDADWGGCLDDRKSHTGFVFRMSGGPISWEAKKQSTTALSTVEAEYMAITQAAKESRFLSSIVNELDATEQQSRTIIECDNQGAIQIASNNGYSPRTKHIDIRFHYIREMIEKDLINLKYIRTDENIADIFTKALGRNKHEKFTNELLN